MSDGQKIVLIEFNELSPTLLDKWMGEGKLPNFKKLHDRSVVHVSAPDVEESEFLEPWIQWYSMHVGRGFEEHKVFHLTDGAKTNDLDIWTHLKNKGKKTQDLNIVDCTACIGGDCISFSKYFNSVLAIEKNKTHFKIWKENANFGKM